MPGLSVAQIEAASLTAWPAVTTAMDGLWLARFARGYTKRSNSIQCLDPQDDADAPARLARLADLYPLNSLDPLFRVTPLAGPGVVAALDADGWAPFEESLVLSMPLALGEQAAAENIRVLEAVDPKWIAAFVDLAGIDRGPARRLEELLNLIAVRNAGILVLDSAGEPVAAASVANAGGVAVTHNVITRKDARGRGFGRQAVTAALGWAQEVGATSAAIQVLAENAPAIHLYGSLGFEEAYRYHYRRPR